jgi:hypothetical protein
MGVFSPTSTHDQSAAAEPVKQFRDNFDFSDLLPARCLMIEMAGTSAVMTG